MANRFKYKFTLSNCLFGSVELTANTDTGLIPIQLQHRISFSSEFFLADGSGEKIVILFGADLSSSVHIDNKIGDISTLG